MILGLMVGGTFDDNLCRQAYRLHIHKRYGLASETLDSVINRLQLGILKPNEIDILVEILDYNDAIVFKAMNDQHKILGITQTPDWLSSTVVELWDQSIVHRDTIDVFEEKLNDAIIAIAEEVGFVSAKIRKGITRTTT